VNLAALRGQFQMVRAAVGDIRGCAAAIAVFQDFARAVDRHLVHLRGANQVALGQRTGITQHRHDPPFRDLEPELHTIFVGNGLAHRTEVIAMR
jgi:hypothetical protein